MVPRTVTRTLRVLPIQENNMAKSAPQKIGLFGLIGMVISSCIGSGVYALTGQLAKVASPGAIIVAWVIAGVGFLALALSLANLSAKKPELNGIFMYAKDGFGPFSGFLSGWGYWFSAWMGSVGFAIMMMSTVGYFLPAFHAGNSIPCIIVASLFNWVLTILVIRGVESAALLNAVVMVCKVLAIGVFIAFAIFLFNTGTFTTDFWGTLASNASAIAAGGNDLGTIPKQIKNCMIIMMWVFVGIEGATVMSARAEKRSDVGRATVMGLVALVVIYLAASVLPYGYLSYHEIALMDYPVVIYLFDLMAPGWGGTFIALAIILSIGGAWLSFTLLSAETTSCMSDAGLLPKEWGALNKHGSPQMSLVVIAACIQAFLIISFFSADAYILTTSIATAAIVISWGLAAAYQVKIAILSKDVPYAIIGSVALVFLIAAVFMAGWQYLLIASIGFVPGFYFYWKVRHDGGFKLWKTSKVAITVVSIAAVVSVYLLATGAISI